MSADKAPTHTLPNSSCTQSGGAEAEHRHGRGRGSSSSGSAAADDVGSGQQGGSSPDPGVDMIEWLDDADE